MFLWISKLNVLTFDYVANAITPDSNEDWRDLGSACLILGLWKGGEQRAGMVLMMMIAVASEAGLDATTALESALRFGDCVEI